MNDDSSIARIAAILRDEADRAGAGGRLPSMREVSRRYGVGPVTVSRALAMLAAEGRVVTRPGSGAFAAGDTAAKGDAADFSWQAVALEDRAVGDAEVATLLSPAPEGVIALTGGYPHPDLQPLKGLTSAATRAVRRADVWGVPPLGGVDGLRRWFATEAGGDATQADVLVVSGGQAALSHAFRALTGPGRPMLVETPTYPGALAAARTAGLRVVGVPVDEQGVRADLLAEAFAVTGARVFYCQPTLHNPTGATQPSPRREQVLAVARAAGAFVIEDDYGRYLAAGAVPPSLISMDVHGTVVHVNSLSKVTAPSLRVAGITARGPAARRLRAAQLVESFFVPRPLQETALEFLTSPAWRRHRATIATELLPRRDALAAALERHLPQARVRLLPSGGLHLWVRLPGETDETALVERAQREGALVSPGAMYHPAEPPAPHLRLTHTAAAHTGELAEGVRRLAAAYHHITTHPGSAHR
ncbi:PLP-dependent aminotransferase family protein [Sphaerisporangium rubeum]|uniref:DNA-binding transcriptional MocR family regulator n=1 Tax=Sphaerisporangium rubeum TaxID=321317 RepID=A0A7X0IH64_9ACTN|nr:PLP-dependent aminotransferase family protein [Sphaerisporangium rubeum]MBB6475170.1 DNA-binding transcriptional MocR family regulator [Sphaerisporangium rubeum]